MSTEHSVFYHKDPDGIETFLNYPVQINEKNIDVFKGYIDGNIICPLCIKAPKREYRICRQSGNFVCQGSNIQPIDSLGVCREVLYKIYIPYASIKNIQKELQVLNITSNSIYGEESRLDECIKEIRSDEEKKFKQLIEELNSKW